MSPRATAIGLWIKKHKTPLIGALLLAALCVFLACAGVRSDRYRIEAEYDEGAHALHVVETLHYTNRTGRTLAELCFNLWPNAYAAQKTAPIPAGDAAFAYPKGFDPGGAELESVAVNGHEAAYALAGAQRTLLRVQLPFRLRPTGSVQVELRYTVTLPQTRLRMGYSDADVRLCNVFATLCAHDGEQFRTDGYSAIGDPFVSECADWQVTLCAPESYVVCGTGLERTEGGQWRFRGENLRDFALFMSKDYCVAQREQDGVTLRSFAFTQEDAQRALDYAEQALRVFSALYGDYPYPDFSVCAGQLYIGGMEYPGAALVDDSLYHTQDGMLEFVIAHEAAHQWWYAAVGSDQIAAPWQDEALAEYSTLLYYESVYGAESFDSLYQSMVRPATENESLRGVGVGQGLDKFESVATYDALVYRKGAAMLHDLRVTLGNDAFISALRRYYQKNRFALASVEDFLSALDGEGAQLVGRWLRGEAP